MVFVKPTQLIFDCSGSIPYLIGKGTDEWGISFSETLPYKIPQPILNKKENNGII